MIAKPCFRILSSNASELFRFCNPAGIAIFEDTGYNILFSAACIITIGFAHSPHMMSGTRSNFTKSSKCTKFHRSVSKSGHSFQVGTVDRVRRFSKVLSAFRLNPLQSAVCKYLVTSRQNANETEILLQDDLLVCIMNKVFLGKPDRPRSKFPAKRPPNF